MPIARAVLLACVAQSSITATASAQRPLRDVRVTRDVEYGRVGDHRLLLDVYRSKTADDTEAQRPLVVWVHGGGWRSGSKNRTRADRLVAKGYVVASIDYRLSGVAKFPAQMHDCKAALRFLRKHADEYGIDSERVGVWGSSAGGHLVALLGTSGDVESLEGTVGVRDGSSRVQCVVDFYGPTDFLQMAAHSGPNPRIDHDSPTSPESLVIGGPIRENVDKVRAANPITYVSKDDPPFLIVHGDRDPLVPLHQSRILDAALRKASVPVTLHVVEGGGHGWGRRVDVDDLVDEFLAKHLKP